MSPSTDLGRLEASGLGKSLRFAKRQILLKRIRPMEGEYIRSFSSIKEGCRAWDCLITLVEDGTVGEQNIAEYGIDTKLWYSVL